MKKVLLFLTLLISAGAWAQSPKFDLQSFIRETQQLNKTDGRLKLAWWIPTEYWRLALEGNDKVSPEDITGLEEAFGEYVVICALEATDSKLGIMEFRPEKEMRNLLRVKDQEGKEYQPLEEDDLNPTVQVVAASMKPVFRQNLGEMGKGLNLYFFKVQKKGENLIEATREGSFIVSISDTEFTFTTPLGVLMPPKKCPEDGAAMNGNWKYCPFHGKELVAE